MQSFFWRLRDKRSASTKITGSVSELGFGVNDQSANETIGLFS